MFAALARLDARPWLLAALLVAFALLVRAITFDNPILGVDDQFYLQVGDQMVHHGAIPYIDIFDRKPVGLFVIYAAIAALGGDGFLHYQIVACLFVAAGAALVYQGARTISSVTGALLAALIYVLWLGFMEGEGGQSPIFYNPLMIGAALLTWASVETSRRRMAYGALAMLLVGLALQVKYTAVFEGVYFGLVLVWGQWRDGRNIGRTLVAGALWAGIALLPTVLAAAYYWRIGALHAFIFANFYSVFGRNGSDVSIMVLVTALAVVVLAPLVIMALAAAREGKLTPRWVFFLGWAAVAIFAVVIFGSFLNKHYALPLIAPISLLTAPYFGLSAERGKFGMRFVAIAVVLSQVALASSIHIAGGRPLAQMLAQAAQPKRGCIYVAGPYSALYMMTNSCLLSKWIFPGHLRDFKEANVRALDVDPVAELQRVLAKHPETIVDTRPDTDADNMVARRLLHSVEAHDYHPVRRVQLMSSAVITVYRRNDAPAG